MSDFDRDDKTPILLHPARRDALLKQGQELFNEEKFFEAHEAWEELWLVEEGRNKTFVQALIQAAGHFVHLQKKNWSGAKSLGNLALSKLQHDPGHRAYRELDVTPITSALDYNLSMLREGEEPEFDRFLTPKLFGKN